MIDPVSLAITAVLMAAQMALTASQKIEGPRLDSLDVTIADYGTQIPRFWGKKRLEGVPIIWAEKLREKKNTSKTKGGKYTDYKYFGTFAVLIADHEIDSVSRIWMDKHLCFDLTSGGPISIAGGLFGELLAEAIGPRRPVKLAMGKNMRVYYGTETQSPDPRMEAWCEDRYGADSCPAYRGYSYIVFEELPLEKFGNRIPQVTVEAINQVTNAYPFDTVDITTGPITNLQFTDDYSRFMIEVGGNIDIFDTATRTLINSHDQVGFNWRDPVAWGPGGIYGVEGFPSQDLYRMDYDGLGAESLGYTLPEYVEGVAVIEGLVLLYPYLMAHLITIADGDEIDPGFSPTHYFGDGNGSAWAVGVIDATDQVGLYCITGPQAGIGTTFTSPVSSENYAFAAFNADGNITVAHGTGMFIIDPETFAILDTATGRPNIDLFLAYRNVQPGAASVWVFQSEISLSTLDVIRTVNFDNWINDSVNQAVYDPINHAMITISGADEITWRYLDRVGSDGVTLKTVVDDVCGWVGLSGQITTALTQTVLGYSVTQGAGKDMIAPLLDIHDVDPRPHDFSVEFKVRGSAAAGTILVGEFVKNDPRYGVEIAQDTDIPRRIMFNYADETADQQKNTATAQRPLDAIDSVREQTIDLSTYVDEPNGAQEKVERYFRRLWNSRETINNGLTAQRLGLEPADVWNLSLDGIVHTARLTKMTIKGLAIDFEWVRDYPHLTTLSGTTGATMDGRDPDVIYIPLQTKGFALDIPLIRDSDNSINPVIYIGAGPYGPGGWSGAGFYQGDGTDFETLFATVDSATKTTWGFATTILATANPNLWDHGNTVTVRLNTGSLTSHTQAELDANPLLNLFVLGSELFQAATCTLIDVRTYTLSILKRGRRGTEWAMAAHVADEVVVLVENLDAVELGADEIGDVLYFKAPSIGRPLSEAPTIEVAYGAESHKPLSPAHVRAVKNPSSGDWVITWIRRTRIGGRWTGNVPQPLGESTENYEVEILDGPGGSVVRTITATTQTATYTAAQQVTDGGDVAIGDLDVVVRQIGDLADGRDTALAA